jgi:outer membrane protein assembly factor BamE (lipoprotein component of BamABCDE complex)
MFYFSRIAAILLIFMLAACGTVQVGQDFDVRAFEAKVERGISTRNQVRAWLGEPAGTGISVDTGGERFDEWTYYFASGKLPGMAGAKVKMLQVKFDRQGIVRGYNWSTSGQ